MATLAEYFPIPQARAPFDVQAALALYKADHLPHEAKRALIQHLLDTGDVWTGPPGLRALALAMHARGEVHLPYRG